MIRAILTFDYLSCVLAVIRLTICTLGTIAVVLMQLLSRLRKNHDPVQIPRLFHRLVLFCAGVRVRWHGTMTHNKPTMFVCNHLSYLDIGVLGATLPGAFIAKSEVSGWPVIGALARLQETVFVERKSNKIAGQKDMLRDRLEHGQNLILFAEGTTSDGSCVLPFKSSLFAIAEKPTVHGAVTIQPLSLVCTEFHGLPILQEQMPLYAWFGDMTLVPHLWNVFRFGSFTIDVIMHDPISAHDFENRKTMSHYCEAKSREGFSNYINHRIKSESKNHAQ